MNEKRIRQLLAQGEGVQVEFKTCRSALNRDVYETICAFLNRCGGDLLLGVTDNGEVRGVDSAAVEQLKKDFATALNNPQKINPPFYLHLEEVAFEDKTLLHVFVPESSQVHRFVLLLPTLGQAGETPEQATEQATEQASEQEAEMLKFCRTPRSREEMQAFLNLKHREHFRAEILKPLLEKGLLKPTIPEKPTSPKQKYYAARHEGDK